MVATNQRRDWNLRASFFKHLKDDVDLTNVVPAGRHVYEGGTDTKTDTWDDWIEPKVFSVLGEGRRESEARVVFQVDINVRPPKTGATGNIHRSAEIAGAVADVLRNARIAVQDYARSAPGTDVGVVRLMRTQTVHPGKSGGIWRTVVTCDGYFTPVAAFV